MHSKNGSQTHSDVVQKKNTIAYNENHTPAIQPTATHFTERTFLAHFSADCLYKISLKNIIYFAKNSVETYRWT